jgi:hypothetical protein
MWLNALHVLFGLILPSFPVVVHCIVLLVLFSFFAHVYTCNKGIYNIVRGGPETNLLLCAFRLLHTFVLIRPRIKIAFPKGNSFVIAN